jgi:hypothetical protein
LNTAPADTSLLGDKSLQLGLVIDVLDKQTPMFELNGGERSGKVTNNGFW